MESDHISLSIFRESLSKYKADVNKTLDEFNYDMSDVKNNPAALLKRIKDVERTRESIEFFSIPKFDEDIVNKVKERYIDKFNEYSSASSSYKEPYLNKIKQLEVNRDSAIKQKETQIEEYKLNRRHEIENSLKHHTELNNKKDEIEDLFRLYKIDSTGYSSSLEDMQIEDIEKVSKVALDSLSKVTNNPRVTRQLVSLAYYPLILDLKDKSQNFILKISWIVAFLLLCYFSRPYFLALIAFCYFADTVANLFGISKKKEILQMSYALIGEVPIEEYIEDSVEYFELLEQLEELKNIDLSADISKLEEDMNKRGELIETLDPSDELNKELEYWLEYSASQDYTKEVSLAEDELLTLKEVHLGGTKGYLDTLYKIKKMYTDNVKLLGTNITMNEFLGHKVKLGTIADDDGQILLESTVTLENNNLLFTYKNDEDLDECKDFMKLLLCNYLCNIREKHLSISVYDSEDLGKDVSEFTADLKMNNYIKVHSKDFKKKLEDISKDLLQRNKKLNGTHIDNYNQEAQSVGKITMDYEIVIVLSSEFDFIKDKAFRKMLNYSHEKGYIFWLFSKDESLYEKEEYNVASKFYDGLDRIRGYRNYKDADDEDVINLPNYVDTYTYDIELGNKVVSKFIECIDDKKRNSNALPYEEKFRKKYIPDDKIWTYSTLKGVDLLFGLVEGDPEKPYPYTLGDSNVHMIMGGQTGAGKSATINQFLANMLHMYSPEELELIMIDFKNVEFKMYTGDYAIPHASVVAGTKDGEYAISIFQYAIDMMKERTKKFGTIQVNHIELWNKRMKELGKFSEIMPRVVLLIDEFQTMFEEVDDKSIETIKSLIRSITRLARFCGLHLVFTSQSMANTMSADILANFSLRCALRCTSDVSVQLIGNDASSKIKERFGWITINDTTGQDAKANKLYRIPFISEQEIHTYIPMLCNKCKTEGHIDRKAKFYDEDQMHKYIDLEAWYKSPIVREDKSLFILGERTAFSTNKLPANFVVTESYDENILIDAFERYEQCNLYNSFIYQLKEKGIGYILHCADEELIDVMGLKDKVDEKYHAFLSEDVELNDIVESLEEELEYRVSSGDRTPFYFLGIDWANFNGVGQSPDYRLLPRLQTLLHKLPKYNFHIIVVTSLVKEMKSSIPFFKHTICSYHTDTESNSMIDSTKASKLLEGFAIYKYGKNLTKFKIYRFDLAREFRAREVVVKGDLDSVS